MSKRLDRGHVNRSRKLLEHACEQMDGGAKTLAMSEFKIAARLGNAEAQVNLANLYDDGVRYDDLFRRSRYWYKRAWRSGRPEGAYNLAVAFRLRGNSAQERRWLVRAAAMGDEDAADDLRSLGV